MYKHCISLGYNCSVAASMGRYGLRSHSGPFDWLVSDFESILKVMERGFCDFTLKENLFVDKNEPKVFHDKKYGFMYRHDIKDDFEKEYEFIHTKYMHRAERFMEDIKQPTCFIRFFRSEKEALFIEENKEYIYEIIRKKNRENEIIFLVSNSIRGLADTFLWFHMDEEHIVGTEYGRRKMFDVSEPLSTYCRKNILPEEVMKRNREFDRKNASTNRKAGMILPRLEELDAVSIFKGYYSDIEEGLFLWGVLVWEEFFEIFNSKGCKYQGGNR